MLLLAGIPCKAKKLTVWVRQKSIIASCRLFSILLYISSNAVLWALAVLRASDAMLVCRDGHAAIDDITLAMSLHVSLSDIVASYDSGAHMLKTKEITTVNTPQAI